MTAPTAAPDTLLAGRYRLLRARALASESGAGDLWRARDEVLARAVAVRVLPIDDPRSADMLAAAGRAGRLTDSRLARVLDASEDGAFAFVVGEWVDGESLATTLQALGPFDPGRATSIVLDVARVVAAAHAQGLAHLRLHPGNVLVTRGGETKVTDLEVAAALIEQPEPSDFRRADAHGLGLLLYAALTARWPDGAAFGLPAAPRTDGRVASPRQVRAGIPRELEAIVDRCVSATPRRGSDPLRTPSAVAAALAALPQARPTDDDALLAPVHEPGPARQVLRVALPVAAIIAIVVAGWLSGLALGRVPGPGRGFSTTATATPSPGTAATAAIVVKSAKDFDPFGDRQENPDQAPYAVDGDSSTSWQTGLYRRRADFGGLKPGVGLIVDLGRPRSVGGATALLTKAGASIELRAASNTVISAPDQLDDYRVIASARNAGDKPPQGQPAGTVTLNATGGPVTSRFWLVWFTSVPREGSGYRDGIAELTFHG
ncbi:MAG: hypothetical protein QOG53_1639 [Frankiales bacterium]|jgi:hypothetical protein|nr:hypothetical protein [Frankiales bacterium]